MFPRRIRSVYLKWKVCRLVFELSSSARRSRSQLAGVDADSPRNPAIPRLPRSDHT